MLNIFYNLSEKVDFFRGGGRLFPDPPDREISTKKSSFLDALP